MFRRPGVIEVSFLGSGSTGNCAVIRTGKTTVLLDAGLSLRETTRRLALRGVSIDSIDAIFLTHEHSDHIRCAYDLALKKGIPTYATSGTALAAKLPGPLFADVRRVVNGGEVVLKQGDLNVRIASTPHDGAESVCFVFSDADGRRVGVATDLGHLSRGVIEALADCDILGLEANHDVDLLRDGGYPAYLKRRILSDVGHLSNDAAAAAFPELIGARTEAVVALHISAHNNTSALAAQIFGSALLRLGSSIPLEVARPDVPTEWRRAGGPHRPPEPIESEKCR
ncbi:MAG: MBL fold metallo-hydrolase [Thermoanaerobaculia bacterium]